MTRLNPKLVAIVLNPALVNHHPALMADAFLTLVEQRGGTTHAQNLHRAEPGVGGAAQIAPHQRRAVAQIRAMLGKPLLRAVEPPTRRADLAFGLAAHFAHRMTNTPGPDAA